VTRILIVSITFMMSVYWLYAGLIWVFEDWTGKKATALRPPMLRRPSRQPIE
jgi:hypothetical protein